MFKIFLYGLLIWFLYNLVFRFIIPVYKTSKQMKQKFREMQENMQQHANQNNGAQTGATPQSQAKSATPQKPKGDYIEFEEVKFN